VAGGEESEEEQEQLMLEMMSDDRVILDALGVAINAAHLTGRPAFAARCEELLNKLTGNEPDHLPHTEVSEPAYGAACSLGG